MSPQGRLVGPVQLVLAGESPAVLACRRRPFQSRGTDSPVRHEQSAQDLVRRRTDRRPRAPLQDIPRDRRPHAHSLGQDGHVSVVTHGKTDLPQRATDPRPGSAGDPGDRIVSPEPARGMCERQPPAGAGPPLLPSDAASLSSAGTAHVAPVPVSRARRATPVTCLEGSVTSDTATAVRPLRCSDGRRPVAAVPWDSIPATVAGEWFLLRVSRTAASGGMSRSIRMRRAPAPGAASAGVTEWANEGGVRKSRSATLAGADIPPGRAFVAVTVGYAQRRIWPAAGGTDPCAS